MAEAADPVGAAGQAASQAATEAKNKGLQALTWTFNQCHPFGENGKLGRTLAVGTTLALTGAVGAATGAAVPIDTSGLVTAITPNTANDALNIGEAFGGAAKAYGANIINGGAVIGNGAWAAGEALYNLDWSNAVDTLSQSGEKTAMIDTTIEALNEPEFNAPDAAVA